ncbi:hypothetical protein [Paraburkholderia dinghuensis]|uniref:Uncharacterized protein n=1 Tax=Paraburkholderia dinghuensis TaxID=2305225 RepID=A0A3N6NL87_9BURK|nr:hypothetical protein [Paraburkholderia dinghuensis]RQH09737.1 hypothetical protein D1Y85_00865 [Paraburkholderia dinghuensis]
MKRSIAVFVVAIASCAARANGITDYVRPELGAGWQVSRDMGDGTWYQEGGPYTRRLSGPAFMAGLTGPVWAPANWSVRWHLDYVYYGGLEAGCTCVPDAQYNAVAHARAIPLGQTAQLSYFHSQGHVQGIPLTLDAGYSWGKWRFAVDAGAWVYWQTWHVNAFQEWGTWGNLSHRATAQLGYVAGTRIERGPLALSYRYYNVSSKWNPYPGIVTGTNTLLLAYRF